MAWSFNEINQFTVLGAGGEAALALPSDAWTMAGWFKLDDNTGSDYQFLINTDGGGDYWFVVMREESKSPDPNKLWWYFSDSGAGGGEILSSDDSTGQSTNWQHACLVYDGTYIKMYIDGVHQGTKSAYWLTELSCTNPIYFGARSNSLQKYGGDLAEWAKWDRALSTDEITSLAAGFAPCCFPKDLAWYLPMVRNYEESIAGLTVTNKGATIAEHPPIWYPGRPVYGVPRKTNRRRRILIAA